MPTLNVDAQRFYDTCRAAALRQVSVPGGGYAVVHALAVLMGETISSSPVEQHADLMVMVADTVEETIQKNR